MSAENHDERVKTLKVTFLLNGAPYETAAIDVTAEGAVLRTAEGPTVGATLKVLVAPSTPGAAPVRMEVEVTAVATGNGLPVRWLRAVASPDPEPLRRFLKNELHVVGGFVEKLPVGGTQFEYVFHFPGEGNAPAAEAPLPASLPAATLEDKATLGGGRRVKIVLPCTYVLGAERVTGTVVRLSEETCGVVAEPGHLPNMADPVQVVLELAEKRQTREITLYGTVIRVKSSEDPPRFDVLITGLDEGDRPGIFAAYLRHLFQRAT